MQWTDDPERWNGTLPVALILVGVPPAVRREALRSLVARALRLPPKAVAIGHREGRPPTIRSPVDCALHCSSASRDGVAALALARVPVGIDVEIVGGPDEIPWRVLHEAEAAWLRSLDDAGRVAAFARIWSLKEAYLKALGTGLARAPDSIAVDLRGSSPVIDDPLEKRQVAEAHTVWRAFGERRVAISMVTLAPPAG